MKAYIATVNLVINADSYGEACDAVHALLHETGMHPDEQFGPPTLHDWSYIPEQIGKGAADNTYPKLIELPDGWNERPEEERNVNELFAENIKTAA